MYSLETSQAIAQGKQQKQITKIPLLCFIDKTYKKRNK